MRYDKRKCPKALRVTQRKVDDRNANIHKQLITEKPEEAILYAINPLHSPSSQPFHSNLTTTTNSKRRTSSLRKTSGSFPR
jgi:hypothetical protein